MYPEHGDSGAGWLSHALAAAQFPMYVDHEAREDGARSPKTPVMESNWRRRNQK